MVERDVINVRENLIIRPRDRGLTEAIFAGFVVRRKREDEQRTRSFDSSFLLSGDSNFRLQSLIIHVTLRLVNFIRKELI